MKKASLVTVTILAAVGSVLGTLAACGSSTSSPGPGATGGDGGDLGDGNNIPHLGGEGGSSSGGDGSNGACTGLQCQIHACAGVTTGTTITGHVYDPAGHNPLYNVVVYVPNTTVDPLPAAPTNECGACNSLYSGQPIAAGITDATGKFTMNNAPDGDDIPLVVQIGKWRTQMVVPKITACATGDTNNLDKVLATKITLPSVDGISTVPGPTKGLQQDIPQIAISTGGADSLECLLLRIGVDKSEYADGPGGTGHIHIFQGSPVAQNAGSGLPDPARVSATTPSAMAHLWDSAGDLSPYDILILSCEGEETQGAGTNGALSIGEQTALQKFTSAGGRAFLSHFHYAFLDTGPFASPPLASWSRGANPITDDPSSPNPQNTTLGDIVTTLPDGGNFAKGSAFFQWLTTTNALTGNELPIDQPKHNADVGSADLYSQEWIKADNKAYAPAPDGGAAFVPVPGTTQYFTFDTPLGGAGSDDAGDPIYCGRVVYSDLHVGSASGDYPNAQAGQAPTVPGGCADNPLSPQEKALEFMLFDLSSCVTPDTGPSQGPPPIIVPVK